MSSTSIAFFSSAASSFCPAPFPMASGLTASTSRTFSTRTPLRGTDSLVIPQSMDPHPTDPNILFIHPPFNSFPHSHTSPDGLTYNLMAENPEWFLDSNDFVSASNTNPNAIPYPPFLEPPRGWCPAKKKDLKERGAEGWPEGEEPRLRCTFCRRTYAGVNAKSMWRRHVFEKHKIAMSNRRDGNLERPRGRGSGSKGYSITEMVLSVSSSPLKLFQILRLTSLVFDLKRQWTPPAKRTLTSFSEDESDLDVQLKTPLTPRAENSSDPPNVVVSDSTAITSPILSSLPPESPYNPLQTPSFRHSPPRPLFHQPWRFPSPSHPLHSNTCELSLNMVARLQGTPLVKGETKVAVASPLPGIQSSPLSTIVDSTAIATPASSTSIVKPNKRLHLFDQISSPLSAGSTFSKRQRITSSPLPFTTHRTTKGHNRHPSDSSEFWFSDDYLAPSKTVVAIDPTLTDAFTIYESWPITGGVTMMSPVRPLKRPMELESPIVRSGSQRALASDLTLYEGVPPIEDMDDELKEILLSSPPLKDRCKRLISTTTESSPPSKKRKIMTNGQSSSFL